MSDHHQRIDPFTAERLISDAQTGSRTSHDPLADMLATAAVPAHPGELTGEDAAVMAFRSAHLAHASRSSSRSTLHRALAKLATAKTAIVLAALGGGGVALAAGTGHLPGTNPPHNHPTQSSLTGPSSGHAPAPPTTASGRGNATPSQSARHSGTPTGSPSPNLRGQCTAFRTSDNPNTALDDPAYTVLITTAGGKDKVAGYCTTLLATATDTTATHPGDPTPSAPPTQPGGPTLTGDPTQPGAPTHPADQSTHATPPQGGNSTHPTGPNATPAPPSHPTPTPTHTTR